VLAGGDEIEGKPGVRLVQPFEFKFLRPEILIARAAFQFLDVARQAIGYALADVANVA
jgi:hypothetical protein